MPKKPCSVIRRLVKVQLANLCWRMAAKWFTKAGCQWKTVDFGTSTLTSTGAAATLLQDRDLDLDLELESMGGAGGGSGVAGAGGACGDDPDPITVTAGRGGVAGGRTSRACHSAIN